MALPITEQENPATKNIDKVSTLEALRLINNEDKMVAAAVEKVLPEIAATVENIAGRIKTGGKRLAESPSFKISARPQSSPKLFAVSVNQPAFSLSRASRSTRSAVNRL